MARRKHDRRFQGASNILFLVLDADYMMVIICDNSSSCPLLICALFCVYIIHTKKIAEKKAYSDTKKKKKGKLLQKWLINVD